MHGPESDVSTANPGALSDFALNSKVFLDVIKHTSIVTKFRANLVYKYIIHK